MAVALVMQGMVCTEAQSSQTRSRPLSRFRGHADHLALVAGVVAVAGELETELISLRGENAELHRQLNSTLYKVEFSRHGGQPPSQDGPVVPRPASIAQARRVRLPDSRLLSAG